MNYSQRIKILLSLAFIPCTQGMSATYTYRISSIPLVENTFCDDEAVAQSLRLKEFSATNLGQNIEISKSYCVTPDFETDKNSWRYRIEYQSEKELPLISTTGDWEVVQSGYKTRELCEAAKEAETAAFEKNTGLKAFISYCEIPPFADLLWKLTIHGFGTPRLFPSGGGANLRGRVKSSTTEELTQVIAERITKLGGDVAHIGYEEYFAGTSLSYRFYFPKKIYFKDEALLSAKDLADCKNLASKIDQDLTAGGVTNLASYCLYSTVSLNSYSVNALIPSQDTIQKVQPGVTFENAAGCQERMPEIVEHYRKDLKRNILGGYCIFDRNSKKVYALLLEKI